MRLLQIIRENTLNALRGRTSIYTLSSQSYQPEQLEDLAAALSRHSIVSSVDTEGRVVKPATPVKAWNGPAPTEWTTALGDAIKNWKRSTNFQVSGRADRPLEAMSATINHRDLPYLLDARLTTDGYIAQTGRPDDRQPDLTDVNRQDEWSTMEDTKQLNFGVDQVTDMNSFIEGIGWSGWKVIGEEIARIKERPDSRSTVQNVIQRAHEGRQTMPEQWITIWRTRILQDQDYKAVVQPNLASPDLEEINLLPPREVYAGGTDPFKGLYNYFARIAQGLWNKERYEAERAERDRELVADTAADEQTLNNSSIASLAAGFAEALDNSWYVPRFISDADGTSIQELMGQIVSARDWDLVAAEFERADHGFLGYRLADEMEEDEYAARVVTRLNTIRRIMPNRLFAAIGFGATEEMTVEVTYADADGTYVISKQRTASRNIDIKPTRGTLSETLQRDVLFEDTVLRQAIETQGGTIPDADIVLEQENIVNAKELFIVTLENTYPEMTSWYAYIDTIWQEKGMPDLGRARLLGIISEGAKLLQDGANMEQVAFFFEAEILSDREWLVGTESDPDSANANVRFAVAYRDISNSDHFLGGSKSDEIELNDDEVLIKDALIQGDEQEQQQAADDILESNDPAAMYERIYRVAGREGKWLDEELANVGEIEAYVKGEARPDTLLFTFVQGDIPLPIVAPREMARLYNEAIKGLGTKDELLQGLVAQTVAPPKDPYNYTIISEYYAQITGTGDSLVEDIDWENWDILGDNLISDLRELIGEEAFTVETDLDEVPQRMQEELTDMIRSPIMDNVIEFAEVTNRVSRSASDEGPAVFTLENCKVISDLIEELLESDRVNQGTPAYVAITYIYNHFQEEMERFDDEVDTGITDFTGEDDEARLNRGVLINLDIERIQEIFDNNETEGGFVPPSAEDDGVPTDQEAADMRFP